MSMTRLLRYPINLFRQAISSIKRLFFELKVVVLRLQAVAMEIEELKRHCDNRFLALAKDIDALGRQNGLAQSLEAFKIIHSGTNIVGRMRRNLGFLGRLSSVVHSLSVESLLAQQALDRQLMLAGRCASWQVRQKDRIRTLSDVEFRVCSQWGEDGIIDWLVENIPIKETTFVEFGVENYQEANTRFLLQNRNWRGLIMDGNSAYMESVAAGALYWRYDLRAVPAVFTRQNINDLLIKNGVSGDIGLLSIDVDGNDYWILDAISAISPRILICEYNAVWGDLHAITIPYAPDFNRLKAHPSGQYFGASIKAMKDLAAEKGYEFLGTCANGINSFFVRGDLFEAVGDKIQDRRAFPSRHRESLDETGNLAYVRGTKRADLIKHLPVVLVDGEKRQVQLESLYPLYSSAWLEELR